MTNLKRDYESYASTNKTGPTLKVCQTGCKLKSVFFLHVLY